MHPGAPHVDEMAALRLEIIELQKALKVKLHKELADKKIQLDSGANISLISARSHVDPNTMSSCRRADKTSGMETADKTVMPITGAGIFLGCGGVICDEASRFFYLKVNIRMSIMRW